MKSFLVCGGRDWKNGKLMEDILKKVPKDKYDTLVHGACRGADMMAGEFGKALGFTVKEYPAKWNIYKMSAGPIRNSQMLKEADPELLLAFHNDLENSKGTTNMIKQALEANNNHDKHIKIICIDEAIDYTNLVIE